MLGPIYAITDPQLLPGSKLIESVTACLEAGIKTVQLRNKSASANKLKVQATDLVKLCREYKAQLIVNDHVSLALDVGAHGVHLGQEDGDVSAARQTLGTNAIIGVTCHNSIALAEKAQSDGASYVAFGRFFTSSTKPLASPAKTTLLSEAKTKLAIPIVAIGGVNLHNMGPLIQYGADSLAICHEIFAAQDVKNSVTDLINHFHHYKLQLEKSYE